MREVRTMATLLDYNCYCSPYTRPSLTQFHLATTLRAVKHKCITSKGLELIKYELLTHWRLRYLHTVS